MEECITGILFGVRLHGGVFIQGCNPYSLRETAETEDFAKKSATATTAASGRNREELLGQRPAGCKAPAGAEADAGSRNPYSLRETTENGGLCKKSAVFLDSQLR